MYGRKYSFCSKIFKKIYRIAAIYAIIGLTGWPRQHQQLDRRGQELAIAQAAVRQAAQRHVQDARRSLQSAAAVAESLSPYAVLARGYALPEQNGTPCAVETLRPGEAVTLRGARAAAECRVEAVHTLEQKTGE